MAGAELYKMVVDSLSAQVAILDENGIILETNLAWQKFGLENGMPEDYDPVGTSYFTSCETSDTSSENSPLNVAEGIRQVLAGELAEFFHQYPCHGPQEERWFVVRVVPFLDTKQKKIIVTHENITPVVLIQKELEKKEQELVHRKEQLEEANIALRVLLRQRDEDRQRIEETVYGNVDRLVLPYIERMQQGRTTDKQRTLLELIDTNLRDIISPFLRSVSTLNVLLTPQEIEVSHMVRSGRSSKEIADIMNLSVAGVDFHRKRIRQKLGLTNKGVNLRSYLLSLEK